MDTAYQNLLTGLLALISAGLGFFANYLLKRAEWKQVKGAEVKQGLEELHIGCFEAAYAFSKFGTDVNEFIHGEKEGLRAMTAISAFSNPCVALLPRLSSLQRRHASEFSEEWVKVRNAVEDLLVLGARAMTDSPSLGEVTKALNRLQARIDTFALRIERKLESF